ncbi:hypothetical protein DSUL_80031 [Desulfovibrionales bacterium]
MDAVIICCNHDSLPGPIALDWPFYFLPLAGRTILEHVLASLARCGYERAVLVLSEGQLPGVAEISDGETCGMTLKFVVIPKFSGIFESLIPLAGELGEQFLVLPCLGLLSGDLVDFYEEHRRIRATVSYGLMPVRNGSVEVPEILGFSRKALALGRSLVNQGRGVGLIRAQEVVQDLKQAQARLFFFSGNLAVLRLDNIAGLHWANMEALSGRLPLAKFKAETLVDGIWLGSETRVDKSARLQAPLFLGDGCRVARGTVVGPNVLLGAGTSVAQGAILRDTVAAAGAVVYPGAVVVEAFVLGGFMLKVATLELLPAGDPQSLPQFLTTGRPDAIIRFFSETSTVMTNSIDPALTGSEDVVDPLDTLVDIEKRQSFSLEFETAAGQPQLQPQALESPLQPAKSKNEQLVKPLKLRKVPSATPFDVPNQFLQRALGMLIVLIVWPMLLMLYLRSKLGIGPHWERQEMVVLCSNSDDPTGQPIPWPVIIRRLRTDKRWIRNLPSLLDVAAGRLRLIGAEPAFVDELKVLPDPWIRLSLDIPAGLIQPWDAMSMFPASPEQHRELERLWNARRGLFVDTGIIIKLVLLFVKNIVLKPL